MRGEKDDWIFKGTVLCALLLAGILAVHGWRALRRPRSGGPGQPALAPPEPRSWSQYLDPKSPLFLLSPPERFRFGQKVEKINMPPVAIPAPNIVDTARRPEPPAKPRKRRPKTP